MARPTRKKIKFDEDSANDLLQEIYDDTYNIRAKINRMFTKWETRIKENGEIAAIGDTIIKLINAEAKNQDQKIMLLKYLKEVVYRNESSSAQQSNTNTNDGDSYDDSRRDELIEMVRKQLSDKE